MALLDLDAGTDICAQTFIAWYHGLVVRRRRTVAGDARTLPPSPTFPATPPNIPLPTAVPTRPGPSL